MCKNCRLLSNNANEAFANICLQSFQEAQIPPIPPDLIATLPDGRFAGGFFLYRLRKSMIARFDSSPMTETLQTMVSFFSQGRSLHVAAARLLDRRRHDDHPAQHRACARRNVLPLVIESEIERLVPGGSAERLARIVQRRSIPRSRESRAWRCSICAGRVRKTSSSCKRGRGTNWCAGARA